LSLFAERRSEFAVYLREDIGGSATLIRETTERIPISLTYRLSSGKTQASDLSFCAFFNVCDSTDVARLRQRRLSGTLTLGMQRVRVNNPLDPTWGSTLSAEATLSSTVLGSSGLEQFTRLIGDAARYVPLGSTVLALHAHAGVIFAPRLELTGGASNFVPPEQRFYAGGPYDVRGFNRNQLGPLVYVYPATALDTAGKVIEDSVSVAATGGNSIFVANVEWRVPSPVLSSRLGFAGFVDAGTVWERGGSGAGTGPKLRFTPGFGLRFATPLGPVRSTSPTTRRRSGRPALQGDRDRSAGAGRGQLPPQDQDGPGLGVPVCRGASLLMRRRIARSVFILLCGALATALGVLGALLYTPPGRVLLARIVSDQAPRFIRGSVRLGSVRGSWVGGFAVEQLEIRDTAGVLLLSSPRVEVRYRLASLLTGQFVLSAVRVYQPVLQIIKHRGGRANFEEILRLGESPPGGKSPLVELHDLSLVDGTITIRLPWSPMGGCARRRRWTRPCSTSGPSRGAGSSRGPRDSSWCAPSSSSTPSCPCSAFPPPTATGAAGDRAAVRPGERPQLDIRQARGNVRTRGDSLLFELRQVELPRTSLSGAGRLDWPEDTIRYHFGLQAPKLALADLRFISPGFPTSPARGGSRPLR
jgi:hypothetical protein